MKRHALRPNEPLAIDPSAIRHDADGFYLIMGDEVPENEALGSVAIVNVRGALCQFKGEGGDSYEGIVDRVGAALATAPAKVLLSITSPGGVVAGLNECVGKLRAMSKGADVPLVAWIPSLAASAAYAISCACSERLAHESAVVGSVGVISTMVSVVEADKDQGVEFRLITSGKRKADGHLHGPITDAAEAAERARNNELAQMFFRLASKATGLSPRKLQSYEAGIFLGRRAVAARLIDDVSTLDDVLLGMGATVSEGASPAPNEGNVTDRRAEPEPPVEKIPLDEARRSASVSMTQRVTRTTSEADMGVKLDSIIKKTLAAIGTETDGRKKTHLQGKLASLYVAQAAMSDDDEPASSSNPTSSKGDEDSAAAKHAARAKKMAAKSEAMKHRAKAAELKSKAAESEEEAKRCEEEASGGEEDDEAKKAEESALATIQRSASAGLSKDAAEILASQAGMASDALARVHALEAKAAERERQATIAKLVAERRVTPGEAKQWAKKTGAFWAQVEEMRPHALVNVDEDALLTPDTSGGALETGGDLPVQVRKMVDQAIAASGITDPKRLDELRQKSYEAQRAVLANGAGRH